MKQSYKSINQIFYHNNKFDTPESIHRLEKYCLYDGLIFEPSFTENKENSEIKKEKEIPEIKKEKEKIEWFHPKQEDTIFWCIYSFFYGMDEFNEIGHSYGNRILEEKMKIVEFIKKNPKVLKESNLKITNLGIQETISEFMVDKNTSFQGIAALSIYYKIPIYLIHKEKNLYLKFLPNKENSTKKICFLYYDKYVRGQIKYKISLSDSQTPVLDSMICLESHLKPFRPISHYKMDDLEKIANKIGIVSENRIKKQELYEKMSEFCRWV
jgi:hypothetical protein